MTDKYQAINDSLGDRRYARLAIIFNSGRQMIHNYHQLEVIEYEPSPEQLRLIFSVSGQEKTYIIHGIGLDHLLEGLQLESLLSFTEANEVDADLFEGDGTLIKQITVKS